LAYAKTPLIVAFAVCFWTETAVGQVRSPISIQASALYENVYGDAAQWRVDETLPGGVGAEGQIRYTPSALSFGGGVQWTTHNWTDVGEDSNLSLLGIFLEPRYVLPGTDRLGPYLSARLALTRLELKIANEEIGTATGQTFNGGGGILVSISPNLALDFGATFGYTNFSDLESNGSPTGLKTGKGTNIIARVGLAVGL
jgi:hypothetical protein